MDSLFFCFFNFIVLYFLCWIKPRLGYFLPFFKGEGKKW